MKKLWIVIIILLTMVTGCVNADKTDQEMENKIIKARNEYEVESRERVFTNLPGSDAFIKKFNLNPLEIEMVGQWSPSLFFGSNDNQHGLGISSIFLPNRVFIARSQNTMHDEKGTLKSSDEIIKMGYWKVERGELKIKFKQMYVITRTHNPNQGSTDRTEKIETPYYGIGRPSLYKEGAVQRKNYYYYKIPKNIRILYDIDEKDFIRKRHVVGYEGYDDLYTAEKPWYNFMMYPDLDDEDYVLQLRKIIGSGSYGLKSLGKESTYKYLQFDFNKWN
jgi:hypothetical protein